MADSNENILVEFDYNNITIIDPNKVLDENGKAKERYVKQENLMMYANLECKVIPRTKLAVGVAANDAIQTISVADINFLKPGDKEYLEENYSNELTGNNSLIGKADNQPNLTRVVNPNKTDDFFIRQTLSTGGKPGAKDNGFLGIISIDIKQSTDFMPIITVQLVDVKGKALFEGADNSPYAAFFNLPYPMFHLTIKGYYGKAVRLPLMLQNFTSRFDTSTSNFYITLTFYTYKYTMLSEMNMAHLQAAPFMYQSLLNVSPTRNSDAKFKEVKSSFSSVGFQKIKEVYSEYKAKGLISNDFPEISLQVLQNRIEKFVENILDSFVKVNMDSITFCDEYFKILEEYQKKVYYAKGKSWFEIYIDKTNYFVLIDGKQKVYTFTPVIKTQQAKKDAETELETLITEFNDKLKKNKTLGENGKYTIQGKEKSSSIPNPISLNSVKYPFPLFKESIDIDATFQQRNNTKKLPTELERQKLRAELEKLSLQEKAITQNPINGNFEETIRQFYFWFDGNPSTFLNQADTVSKNAKTQREKIEEELTQALNSLLQSKDSGIGFIPTIRNVLAVVFSNIEGFIRLLDGVHKTAWDNRDSKERKNAIFNKTIANASPDTLDSGVADKVPVYPWPQFIVATPGDNGQEKYEVRYPGERDVIDFTKGYLHDIWPEIEFVEEFIKAYTQRTNPPIDTGSSFNVETEPKRISLNAIEFPIKNSVYGNKEEVKFFFEIYERVILSVFYSKLSRAAGLNSDGVVNQFIASAEKINLIESLSNDNPYLIKKLKEYNFNGNNFKEILRSFSNDGIGESWQNFIRGIFVTPYIKNLTTNSNFEIITGQIMNFSDSQPLVSTVGEDKLIDYIKNSTKSNVVDFTDIYPFTNLNWVKNYMSSSEFIINTNSLMDTRQTLLFNTNKKIISNFSDGQNENEKKPFTNFPHVTGELPNLSLVTNTSSLVSLFKLRTPYTEMVTEGELFYKNFTGQSISHQTNSIFNTPYFINSIQNGVEAYRTYATYPFVQSAYLFLNSLPLGTLRERYKTYSLGATTELSYIFATMRKFGAVHRVPYAWMLRIGSIWHRYKTYINTGKDILSTAWSGFNYTNNFDPVNNNPATTYSVITNNSSYDISLQQNTTIGPNLFTTINTGFYPKLINDFNVFYQGFNLFSGYTSLDIQSALTTNLSINFVPTSNIILPKGFDKNNSNRTLQLIAWSVLVNTDDNQFQYIMPSHGAPINQTYFECFKDITNTPLGVPQMKSELLNNQSMYDGSVRLLWGIPNYGYFDNSKVLKPQPDEYLRKVSTTDKQENFSIRGEIDDYSKISELFSVFQNSDLDKMEQEFLNFSKSVYDFDESLTLPQKLPNEKGSDKTSTERVYQNFQSLMRNIMVLPKGTPLTTTNLINDTIKNQYSTVKTWLNGFLNYNVIIKIGNPSFFDRKLFYSFSSLPIVDPYIWDKYTTTTPNAVPTNGGNITLANSKLTYPNEWKTLQIYVGFSEIPELEYTDNGSYITDFFVDMNVAFTQQNIIDFAPIIKIYATQKLTQFSASPTPPPQPSPNVPEQIVATANLQDGSKAEILNTPGIKRRVRLINTSQQTFYIGQPTISLLTSNRQLINDALTNFYGNFLINPIVGTIVENPPPSFPPVPNPQTKLGFNKFINTMDEYLRNNENIQTEIFNELFGQVRQDLPNVSVVPEVTPQTVFDGLPAKVELWDSFKSLNDKWISGNDFKTKTLFEDVLFLDRASRDIGNKIIVDIIKLKNRLKNLEPKISVLSLIQSIITENNFVIMNLPTYVNFYNVQDVVKNAKPQPEGTLEFANSLFGTFLNVDYRNSSSKMICMYGGRPSTQLEINNNVDYRYRNDSFDLRKASDNPLVEDPSNKNDWAQSNKVVGFNVDIGPQNQSIFTNFSVSQEQGLATAESLEILNQMANQAGGRKGTTQSVSLFNVYKNRSYTCNVEMLGNALIQPTMYFNLRYVPMFSGPYMITSVSHSIRPGSFMTTFSGIRQPTASLPKIDTYLQSLRSTLLNTLQSVLKQQQTEAKSSSGTSKNKQAAITSATATQSTQADSNQTCPPNSKYSSYVPEINPQTYRLNSIQMKQNIHYVVNDLTINTDSKNKLKVVLFVAAYLFSWKKNEKAFVSYEYNFTGTDLTEPRPGSLSEFAQKKYFCGSTTQATIPYVQFNEVDSNMRFLAKIWDQRMLPVKIEAESITKFWIQNKGSIKNGSSLTNEITTLEKSGEYGQIRDLVDTAIKLYNQTSVSVL